MVIECSLPEYFWYLGSIPFVEKKSDDKKGQEIAYPFVQPKKTGNSPYTGLVRLMFSFKALFN